VTDEPSPVEDKLVALRASYATRLVQNLQDMDAAARKLAADTSLEETRSVLAFLNGLAHRITGSGATFGFPGISKRAYELERLVETLSSAEATLLPDQRGQLCSLMDRLVSEAGSAVGDSLNTE